MTLIEDRQEDSWSVCTIRNSSGWQRLQNRQLEGEYPVPTVALPVYIYKQ